MLQALVFDVGNVLIRWDPNLLYAKLLPDPEERAAFFRDVMPPEWNLEQDRGRDWREAEALLISRHPEKAPLIQAYRARWHEMIPEAIHANVAVLTAAKSRGIPVFAITNFAADTFAEAQARFPFLSQFDGIVVSAAERLLKPDPAIFTLFLSRYDLRAEACLFMDDSAANIAAADALGFCTILVKPDTDLRKEVIRQGFTL